MHTCTYVYVHLHTHVHVYGEHHHHQEDHCLREFSVDDPVEPDKQGDRDDRHEDEVEPQHVDRDHCVILAPDHEEDQKEKEGRRRVRRRRRRRRTSAPTGTEGEAPPHRAPARSTECHWPRNQICCCPETFQDEEITVAR